MFPTGWTLMFLSHPSSIIHKNKDSINSVTSPQNHTFFIKWRLSSVALAVWTVSYSNFTAWPLLIRWCFVSSWPAVSLLLSSVRLSVRLSVRNPAGLRRSERGRTTATVQSNWLGKSSSRTSPACCPSTSLWERATCERNNTSEDVWHSSHLCVCTNISVSEI